MKEILIRMTEKQYDSLNEMSLIELHSIIRNGIPLPKGHGRLIDADELEECKEIMNTISGESKYAVRMDDIRNMQTIIEADKEGADDE